MSANVISLPKQKLSRKEKRRMKKAGMRAPLSKPVSLNFDTSRIFAANQAAPVDQIVFNATDLEAMSFQPTVKVELRQFTPEMLGGVTVMNTVGKRDYLKTQVVMLFSIAALGLMIGFFIAYFI
jgi:hypothetical protein